MKTVYVAGAFRAPTPWEVEQNVRKAENLALALARVGAAPLCPHPMFRFFNGLLDDRFWLEATLELLRRCDALALLPSWEQSSGSQGEKAEAERLGRPIFYIGTRGEIPAGLTDWLRKDDGDDFEEAAVG